MSTAAVVVAPLNVRSVLRVNHAGEYGAVRIYQAQLALARIMARDLVPFLEQTLAHEIAHRDRFRALMTPRGVAPCGAMPVWGVGGWMLGCLTGVFGRNAILACTEAVERTVHHHLGDQLRALADSDPEVSRAISDIQTEELGHLDFAESTAARDSWVAYAVRPGVAYATALLIWLSTYGEALVLGWRVRRTR